MIKMTWQEGMELAGLTLSLDQREWNARHYGHLFGLFDGVVIFHGSDATNEVPAREQVNLEMHPDIDASEYERGVLIRNRVTGSGFRCRCGLQLVEFCRAVRFLADKAYRPTMQETMKSVSDAMDRLCILGD